MTRDKLRRLAANSCVCTNRGTAKPDVGVRRRQAGSLNRRRDQVNRAADGGIGVMQLFAPARKCLVFPSRDRRNGSPFEQRHDVTTRLRR